MAWFGSRSRSSSSRSMSSSSRSSSSRSMRGSGWQTVCRQRLRDMWQLGGGHLPWGMWQRVYKYRPWGSQKMVCSYRPRGRWQLGSKGQMAVEMAVVMPILLALAGVTINLMIFLGDCARFDRVAAEAVRTQAASPSYSNYSSETRAQDVQALIALAFSSSDYLTVTVSVSEGAAGAGAGSELTLSLIPKKETYTCTLYYRPWGFGKSFFGIEFSGISHTRQYVIDPYRPGVFF